MATTSENETKANNQLNGSAVAAVAAEKPKWVKQSLPRSESVLGTSLKAFTKHDTRKQYEKHNVKFQCEAVLGPFGKNRNCWLCGFPIGHLSAFKDPAGKFLFTFDGPKGQESKMMDDGTCEHVLPVKLGHGILELLYLEKDPASEQLLHAEYEFAHNYCNFVKSDEYFVSLPLGSTNFCSLELKEDIMDGVLKNIFHKQLGSKGSPKSSLLWTDYEGKRIYFKNPLQAYCFTMNRKAYLEDPEKVYRDIWFPYAKKILMDKMTRLISYVKIADHCAAGNNLVGTHYQGFQERLETGLKNLPRGLKSPQIGRLGDPYKSRIARIQRSPSLNNILAGFENNDRVYPFRSTSLSGYEVNQSYSRPGSRGSRASPTTTTVSSTENSPNEVLPIIRRQRVKAKPNTNTNTSSEEEVEAEVKEKENANASDESSSSSRRNGIAKRLTRRKGRVLPYRQRNRMARLLVPQPLIKGFQPRTRKQTKVTNNNNNNNNSVVTNTNNNIVAVPRTQVLKNGLLANIKENGIHISGRTTFKHKNNIKALGAKWNPADKSWVLPLGANLSTLV